MNWILAPVGELWLLAQPSYIVRKNTSNGGKGQEINADEQMVTVEIAEEKKYRIYSYPSPENRQQRYPEARKAT